MNARLIVARIGWGLFLVYGVACWFFLEVAKRDSYFVAHYSHQPMGLWTRAVTTLPFVYALVPLLWYRVVRRTSSLGGGCLSMVVAAFAMLVGLACFGPGIQM